MDKNERGGKRGIDINFIAIEQRVEQMSDEDLLGAARKLDTSTRRIIRSAWGLSGLDRESFSELASTAKAKSNAGEKVHQQILNWMSLRPEILDKLNRAINQADESESK